MRSKPVLYLICFCVLFIVIPLSAPARSKTDSLTGLINTEKDLAKKHALYLERAVTYPRNELDKAYRDVEFAGKYFKGKRDFSGLADYRLSLADVYFLDRKYKKSLENDSSGLRLSDSIGYVKGKARALGNIARELFLLGQYQEVAHCLEQAIALEKKLRPLDHGRLAELYNRMGIIKAEHQQFGESFDFAEKAIDLALKYDNKPVLARAYTNYANHLNRSSRYESAVQNHLKAIHISEELKDTVSLQRSYNNIAITFRHLKEYDKAIGFYKKSIALARDTKSPNSIGLGLMNLATVYVNKGQTEQLDTLYHESIANFKKSGNFNHLATAYHNYGNYLLIVKQYDNAEVNLNKALDLRKRYSARSMVISTLSVLGHLMLEQHKLKDAEAYLLQANEVLKNGKASISPRISSDLNLYLKRLYFSKKDYEKAYAYQQKEMEAAEKMYDESEKVNALKLQAEYELKKRDSQIEAEREIHRHKQMFIFSAGGAILLILILFVFILLQRRRQAKELHRAELMQLQQQHRLSLAGSLARAEQEERKKIANKLHDETNGILSIARLNLDQLEEKVFVAGSDAGKKLQAAKKLLSEASESIRGISHSLMPLALEKYGLKAALQELTNAINTAGKIKVEEVIEGLENTKSWNPQLSLTIYRMVQEAFSNIIKHAQATHVFFQVVELDDSVTVYIEDNGSGLKNDPSDTGGIGLNLLKQNIEYLNGKVEINSKESKGTFVLAELPLHPEAGF